MTEMNNPSTRLSVKQIEQIWHELPGREIIQDKPQHMWDLAIREAFAHALIQANKMDESRSGPPWDGEGLPPMGAEVLIRHGRDDDEHLCVVTGYAVAPSLDGNVRNHRVMVDLLYKGTDTKNSRMLCDIRPAGSNSVTRAHTEATKPNQVIEYEQDRYYRREYEATLRTIASCGWTLDQVKDLAARMLEKSGAKMDLEEGSVRKAIDSAASTLAAIETDVANRGYRVFNEKYLDDVRQVIASLVVAGQTAVALEGRPIIKPVASYVAFGVMRKKYGKQEAMEVFHGAQWHDKIELENDERLVKGWFLTEVDASAGTGLGQGPRAIEILR